MEGSKRSNMQIKMQICCTVAFCLQFTPLSLLHLLTRTSNFFCMLLTSGQPEWWLIRGPQPPISLFLCSTEVSSPLHSFPPLQRIVLSSQPTVPPPSLKEAWTTVSHSSQLFIYLFIYSKSKDSTNVNLCSTIRLEIKWHSHKIVHHLGSLVDHYNGPGWEVGHPL